MCDELKLSVVVRANASSRESVVLTTGTSLALTDAGDLHPSLGPPFSYLESLVTVDTRCLFLRCKTGVLKMKQQGMFTGDLIAFQ